MGWRGALAVCLTAFSFVARAEPPPPPGAAALARDPALLDRFMAAVMDGPPYYNFMQLPVDGGRLARVADGMPLKFFNWSDFSAEDPAIIGLVRELTGLADDPASAQSDDAPLIIYEEKPALDTPRPQISIDPPFYVATDLARVPGAACGGFAMAMHPLKPREPQFMTIRMVAGTPEPQRRRCLAQMLLRVLGLAGLPEIASGLEVPADADPETMLTAQEELFLWLAYRIPVGTDREGVRAAAAARLEALAARP